MRMWRLRLSLAKWSRRSKLQWKGIGEVFRPPGSPLQAVWTRPVASEGQVEKSYEQEQKLQSGKGWKEFA